MIKEIVEAVSIPVMAKVRIGHFVEAQVTALFLRPRITSATRILNSVIVSSPSQYVDNPKHWNRLHRRVRSADSRGRGASHQQAYF